MASAASPPRQPVLASPPGPSGLPAWRQHRCPGRAVRWHLVAYEARPVPSPTPSRPAHEAGGATMSKCAAAPFRRRRGGKAPSGRSSVRGRRPSRQRCPLAPAAAPRQTAALGPSATTPVARH
eukprot:2896881-Prymnesium_polylepis.1